MMGAKRIAVAVSFAFSRIVRSGRLGPTPGDYAYTFLRRDEEWPARQGLSVNHDLPQGIGNG
jgi:hypothetical protein